jgi:hypothetical protein
MADNSFRSFRRDAPARDSDPLPRDGAADPLAELARIIGQSDPHGGQARDTRQADAYDDAAPASDLDWAAGGDGYADDNAEADDGYAPPRPAETFRSQSADAGPWPASRDYEDEPPAAKQYSNPPALFPDTREEAPRYASAQDARGRDEPRLPGRRQSMSFAPPAPESLRAGESSYAGNYDRDEYDEESSAPPRRSGTVVILAVLGLAVLGTAGALGYRAMFGGSVLPSLPPIIKPADGPIKITPSHDAQGGTPSQADAGGHGGDQVVTHQEQPVDLPPVGATPRVITTIPVISNSPDALPGAPSPTVSAPGSQGPNSAQFPVNPQSGPAPGFGVPDQLTSPTPPPAGSREVQTLSIRPDQSGGANPQSSAPTPAPAPVARTARTQPAARPRRTTAPDGATAGPMSIVPTQDAGAQPQQPRTRMALARPPSSSEPVASAPPSAGGAYAVQVSSQRSEAEAQAAFRSLQQKFPQQLGGRHAIVRRADLGAKGIYYRALVGPFASSEQAAGWCSSLKAAGGNCLIQRN